MKLKKEIKLMIAADGGSASGKTTAAKLISRKYGLKFLSSGLLYRYISHRLLSEKKLIKKTLYLKKITRGITLDKLKNKKLFGQKVTLYSSKIAKSKKIRSLNFEILRFQNFKVQKCKTF